MVSPPIAASFLLGYPGEASDSCAFDLLHTCRKRKFISVITTFRSNKYCNLERATSHDNANVSSTISKASFTQPFDTHGLARALISRFSRWRSEASKIVGNAIWVVDIIVKESKGKPRLEQHIYRLFCEQSHNKNPASEKNSAAGVMNNRCHLLPCQKMHATKIKYSNFRIKAFSIPSPNLPVFFLRKVPTKYES